MRGRVSLAGDAYQGATIERRDVATERGQTAVFVGPRKHRRAWEGHRCRIGAERQSQNQHYW